MGTAFGGTDVLFSKSDKQTYKDFDKVYILNTAAAYAIDEGKTTDNEALNAYVKKTYGYSEFVVFKGEVIRDAVKTLFGEKFEDTSAEYFNFNYRFDYDSTNDIYIRKYVGANNVRTTDYVVYAKALKTTEEDKNLKVEVVVAYVYGANNYYSFTKDSNFKSVVFESEKYEMDKDKVGEFDHFVVTLKKDGDNYVFESIEKK